MALFNKDTVQAMLRVPFWSQFIILRLKAIIAWVCMGNVYGRMIGEAVTLVGIIVLMYFLCRLFYRRLSLWVIRLSYSAWLRESEEMIALLHAGHWSKPSLESDPHPDAG